MTAKACTGRFHVHKGRWTVPPGKTPHDCTYCEWCVANQCVPKEPGAKVYTNLTNCCCDCPQKAEHASIQPYNCGKHEGLIGHNVVGTCQACHRRESTSSSAERYCEACSALYNLCGVCGVTPEGRYPMRRVTKMLAAENGRGRRDVSDSESEDGDNYGCL